MQPSPPQEGPVAGREQFFSDRRVYTQQNSSLQPRPASARVPHVEANADLSMYTQQPAPAKSRPSTARPTSTTVTYSNINHRHSSRNSTSNRVNSNTRNQQRHEGVLLTSAESKALKQLRGKQREVAHQRGMFQAEAQDWWVYGGVEPGTLPGEGAKTGRPVYDAVVDRHCTSVAGASSRRCIAQTMKAQGRDCDRELGRILARRAKLKEASTNPFLAMCTRKEVNNLLNVTLTRMARPRTYKGFHTWRATITLLFKHQQRKGQSWMRTLTRGSRNLQREGHLRPLFARWRRATDVLRRWQEDFPIVCRCIRRTIALHCGPAAVVHGLIVTGQEGPAQGAAFAHWAATVAAEKAAMGRMLRTMGVICNQATFTALTQWRAASEAEGRRRAAARKQVTKVLNRLENGRLAIGFLTWADRTFGAEAQVKAIMQRAVARFTTGRLALGWAKWEKVAFEATEGEAEARAAQEAAMKLVTRALSRMAQGKKGVALRRWRAMAAEYRRRQAIAMERMVRTVRRICGAQYMAAWRRWGEYLASQRRAVACMTGTIHRLLSAQTAAGFDTWTLRLAEAAAAGDLMRRVLARLVAGAVAAGFGAWLRWWYARLDEDDEIKATMERLRLQSTGAKGVWRALTHFVHAKVVKAFEAWRADWAAAKEAMDRMVRTIKRICNQQYAAGWNRWTQQVAAQKAAQERALALMTRVYTKLLHNKTSMALEKWVTQHREEKELMWSTMLRLAKGKVQSGFRVWKAGLDEWARRQDDASAWRSRQLAASAKKEAVVRVLMKTLGGILNARCRAGWNKWWAGIRRMDEGNRVMQTMVKAVSRVLTRGLSLGFGSWKAWLGRQKLAMDRMLRTLNRVCNQQLVAGVNHWRGVLRAQRKALKIMTMVMQRMLNAQTAAGWSAWRAAEEARAAERALLIKVMNRAIQMVVNAGMADCFYEWIAWMRQQEVLMKRMVQTLQRIVASAYLSGFNKWKEALRAQEQEQRVMQTMVKAVSRVLTRGLSLGFGSWKAWLGRQKLAMDRMLRTLNRVCNQQLVAGVGKWKEVVRAQNRAVKLMTQTLQRLVNATLAAGWSGWLDYLGVVDAQEALLVRVMTKAINMVVYGGMADAWYVWAAHCEEQRGKEAQMRRVLRRMVNVAMASCWSKWAMFAVVERLAAHFSRQIRDNSQLAMLVRVMTRMANVALAGAVARWRAHVEVTRAKMLRIMRRIYSFKTALGFERWRAVLAFEDAQRAAELELRKQMRRAEELCCRVLAGWAGRYLDSCFRLWYAKCKLVVQQAYEARIAEQERLQRKMKRTLLSTQQRAGCAQIQTVWRLTLKLMTTRAWIKWKGKHEMLKLQGPLEAAIDNAEAALEEQQRSSAKRWDDLDRQRQEQVKELADFNDRQRVQLHMQNKRMDEMRREMDALRKAVEKAGAEDSVEFTPDPVVVESKKKVEDEDPSLKFFRKAVAASLKPTMKKMPDAAAQKLLLEVLQAKAKADKADEREGNEKDTMQEFIIEFFISKFGKGGTMAFDKCGQLLKALRENGEEAEREVALQQGARQRTGHAPKGKQFQRVFAQLLCLFTDSHGDAVHAVNERFEHFLADGVGALGPVRKGGKGTIGAVDGMKALSVLNTGCERLSTDERLQMNYILRLDAMLQVPAGEKRKANSLNGTFVDAPDFIWLYAALFEEATKTGNINQKRRRNSTAAAMSQARRMSQQGVGPETL